MSQYWSHQFTKNGNEVQIGEQALYNDDAGMSKKMRPIYAQPMICVHCHTQWMKGRDSQPVGSCPARSDKSEAKRLGIDPKRISG